MLKLDDREIKDNTVIVLAKFNGKTYGLGYMLTGDDSLDAVSVDALVINLKETIKNNYVKDKQ